VNDCWRGKKAEHNCHASFSGDSHKFAYQRVVEGKRMSGVIEVNRSVPINVAIEDILLLAALSKDGELEGQIVYLPLR
jgi:hypothetical protein